jgi:YHS domain-containing protein
MMGTVVASRQSWAGLWGASGGTVGEAVMEKDVVCGMQVDETSAPERFEYGGRTFHFCSPSCKAKFVERPEAYANRSARIRQHASAVFIPPPGWKPR